MSKYLNALLIILVVFTGCQGQQAKIIAVERDTTITPATSFSELFLDSTKLEAFIKAQQAGDSTALQLRKFL